MSKKRDEYELRDFQLADSQDINRIALSAFNQYRDQYTDWSVFSDKIAHMALLAEQAEKIVSHYR